MNINKEMILLLDDLMIENIAKMTQNELCQELGLSVDELDSEALLLQKKLNDISTEFNKAKLKEARFNLEHVRKTQSSKNISQTLTKAGKDAKGILIDMFTQNKLPAGLTLAFRDGKEITNDEAEQILADLINIGVVEGDDRKG
ncbi:hypothetical protein [Methylophaga pinxianii]|jgi:hypothetical protein|uniref:hypothetical protein n=1 Tax=Methylophaga pinxianii TaxID=2881052 RepID=UPI001CF13BAA|nr:hypothetical protein [Methylophaga pinxianii]MCB2425495.1 hypothetical protein [Methylophaga pinxianii]UPH46409.1 hypothetical protein LGT42_003770 [Methylophaga pinxianii]|tara:strand:+ start:8797 stop:9228 length:432 start_codon:yes stop_codon:yes gene_type:complete